MQTDGHPLALDFEVSEGVREVERPIFDTDRPSGVCGSPGVKCCLAKGRVLLEVHGSSARTIATYTWRGGLMPESDDATFLAAAILLSQALGGTGGESIKTEVNAQ